MLNNKKLEAALECTKTECANCENCDVCSGINDDGIDGLDSGRCVKESAKTAVVALDILKRLEWGAIANWGNDRRCTICLALKSEGHKFDCELGMLLMMLYN